MRDVDEIDASAPRLPTAARWVAIEVDNHAWFSWYDAQAGDNPVTGSREFRQRITAAETARHLTSLTLEQE